MEQEQVARVGGHHNDEVTAKAVRDFAASAESRRILELNIGTQCSLDDSTVDALVDSLYTQNLVSLRFHEVSFSVAAFRRILELPNLQNLYIRGGYAMDYGNATFVFPTLAPEHIDALIQSAHREKLRRLDLDDQHISEERLLALRAACPHLVELLARDADAYTTKKGTLELPWEAR